MRVVGKVTDYRGRLEFHHPDLRDIEPDEDLKDALIPIYVETEGISSVKIAKLIQVAFADMKEWPAEKLPLETVRKYQLMNLPEALHKIHNPEPEKGNLYNEFRSEAHKRLIFEEFFWLELFLASK
ncbi:MAG: ATP-dependent helicase RecG, partial [Pseudobdellovibrio sp.]|nr:ATP-dependent helicase RecG [Pseudobdellovibrio sp.]